VRQAGFDEIPGIADIKSEGISILMMFFSALPACNRSTSVSCEETHAFEYCEYDLDCQKSPVLFS
jgi:hypothetical protein